MGAVDELVAKWRSNPDAESTLALCSFLSGSPRPDLVQEVGASAETWHRKDGQVMLAVGRMYLDSEMLQEAQGALVIAGKVDPRDPLPYRFLGEVLLRRGDALRAEKVLGRAIQLGVPDPDARLWHDRATVYVALQKRVGVAAVAKEVARTLPSKTSIPPPTFKSVPPPVPRFRSAPPPPLPPISQQPTLPEMVPQYDDDETTGIMPVDAPAMRAMGIADAVPALPAAAPLPERATGPGNELPTVPRPLDPPTPPPARVLEVNDDAQPAPETVLLHLSKVGVYEPGGGAAPAWEAAPRQRQRGTWVIAAAIVVTLGAGYGGLEYSRRIKAQQAEEARGLEREIVTALASADVARLEGVDATFSRVFDLDSRSQPAGLLWLESRVLKAVMLRGEPRGIEAAIQRARTVGVPEPELAFARIASFLAEGDLAGAAGVLPKWDEPAEKIARYQLMAAIALERAGDQRAIHRYQLALELQPSLLGHILLAQLVALEIGGEPADKAMAAAREQLGQHPAAKALSALAWVAGDRAEPRPADAQVGDAEFAQLPVPVQVYPVIAEAVEHLTAGKREAGFESLERAISLSVTPAAATFVGFVAIEAGADEMARKAALRAVSFSALYPRARALAARVAVASARIEEAKKAIQELDPSSPEVAIVRAAVAYEALDQSELESAAEVLAKAGSPEFARALIAAPSVVGGNAKPDVTLEALSAGLVTWGQLVAVDLALDRGDLDGASKLVEAWGARAESPVYALRVARVARYRGQAEAAVKASGVALDGGVTARVLIERVDCLLAADYSAGARELVAKYPAVLGPLTDWLKISADVATNRLRGAKVAAAMLEPPTEDSPLLLRVMAARALGAVGDRRGKAYAAVLLAAHPQHPDIRLAAQSYGLLK